MNDYWGRLKNEIKKQNTTQEWVAGQIGVSYRTFRGWMYRKIMPNADQVVAIAEALDTTVEYLVTGKNPDTWQPPRRYADIVEGLEMLDNRDLETVRAMVMNLSERSNRDVKREA